MIGVFDSGIGGLTILRALRTALPTESFLYFGDNANAPYGEHTPEEIYRLTCESISFLFSRGCRLVILACNSAASAALRRIQQEWLPAHFPEHRVLGVAVPAVEEISGLPWHTECAPTGTVGRAQTVAVFATPTTIASGLFPRSIIRRNPAAVIHTQACATLTPMIESGASREDIRREVVRYVDALATASGMRTYDAVLLACTHYPLIEDIFREALPTGTHVYSQPDIVAKQLVDYLHRHPTFAQPTSARTVTYLTSGDAAHVSAQATKFLGEDIAFQKVVA